MEEVDISLIVSILITMVFSAFFSGMEIAFVSSNRMLAEMDKEKNGLTQRLLSLFYNHPNGFVSTMLVGNNIALVVYGILIARLFDNTIFAGLDDGVKVTCDTILSTLIVLFTGEFLPKTLFKSNPNRLLSIFSPFAYLCYVILWPISKFSTFLSKGLLRMVGMKMESEEGAMPTLPRMYWARRSRLEIQSSASCRWLTCMVWRSSLSSNSSRVAIFTISPASLAQPSSPRHSDASSQQ